MRQSDTRLAEANATAKKLISDPKAGEGFVLIGKGTRITGEIGNCSVVEIQGTLEGDVSTSIVIVREGGTFKGEFQAEQAEVHGNVEGRVTVHGLLDVRKSGRVTGEVTYETLAVAVGAHLAGQLQTPATIDAVRQSNHVDADDAGGVNGLIQHYSTQHAVNGTNGRG